MIIQCSDVSQVNEAFTLYVYLRSAVVEYERVEGDMYSNVTEFKTDSFSVDQTLASMLCVATGAVLKY